MNDAYDPLAEIPKPWKSVASLLMRGAVWGVIIAVLYTLRTFSLLIFLTFIFGYIQAGAVKKFESLIENRHIRVVLVALILLSFLLSIGLFLVPRVKDQAEFFANRYTTYLRTFDSELVKLGQSYPILQSSIPEYDKYEYIAEDEIPEDKWSMGSSPTAIIVRQFTGNPADGSDDKHLRATVQTLSNIGGSLLAIGSAFLLSLLFSFLIVLDLPALTKGVRGLRNTKLRIVYDEVGDSIYEFAAVLGQAMQAQMVIAFFNTIFTIIGIQLLGISENTAFVAVIVFLCSFIPVAGVIISSIPICLMALQGGAGLMLLSILLIWVIHLIETYVINPKIYGHHLRLNAVLVLIILTIGGKLFHIWGLVLGLPVCTYVFKHAIHYREKDAEADGVTSVY